MAFFDKVSKILYTDAIQNIGWQPYTHFTSGRWYFHYKSKFVPLEGEKDLIRCYNKCGIKIRPLSDLIDNVYIKDLIEISNTDYILNNKYCHSNIKTSSLSFNRLGTFLGIPKHRFNQVRTTSDELKKNKIPRQVYYARLKLGWDKEKAKTTPVKNIGSTYDHEGREFSNQKEMLNYYGISRSQFFKRKKMGLSLEECLAPTEQKFNSSQRTVKTTKTE